MNLCRDCKHFLEAARCGKSPMRPDYVNGTERGFYMAQAERECDTKTSCGAEGKWFEQREVA